MTEYIALDLHKQFTFGVKMSARGEVLQQFRFPSTAEALRRFAQTLGPDHQVVLESTTNAFAFQALLAEHAGKVVVSNPLQTKAIAQAKIKTDKVDATVLAQLLRSGFIPEVWVPDQATQLLREQVSHRTALVSMRTQVKNRIHSLLHRHLITPPKVSDLFGASGRRFLEGLRLPAPCQRQLNRELRLLDLLQAEIAEAERELAKPAAEAAEVRLLLSLPGVSLTVGVGLWAAIGEISRFPSPKQLASYFGLNPAVRQSGPHCYTGRISKRGRSHARWLLVEAATSAVRVPGPLRAFYLRLRRGKPRNVAIVACARKLATLIWQMLTNREPYRWAPPLRTHEKIRRVEILATGRRRNSGPQKGQPSKGGRLAYLARRRSDWDLAKIAQAQYQQLLRSRTPKGLAPQSLGEGRS